MKVAADWVADHMKRMGLDSVRVYETKGHPVVYGESLKAGASAPTALIYGHYDVQPPEPLELWTSGPFEPTVRGDHLYGRGVSDMKGQVAVALDAVEALTSTSSLPINVKFLVEGEEEIGSPSLPEFITSHKDLLKSDFAINPDTGMIAPDAPAITYALRGLAYYEIRIFGPDHDLHSGTFGGVVDNPAKVLCELIAGMHDEQGHVTLPGFYDKVRMIGKEERAELARLPMDETYYLKATGAPALRGESGYIPAEQAGARPTLEVNGLLSGYTAAGAKTVLPCSAMAKISMRLVPDQQPAEVAEQLRAYLEDCAPPTIRWEMDDLTGGPASISDTSSEAVQALSKAMETVWGTRPLFKREGGSVPVVGQFQRLLGIESVNTGFSFPDDNAHSPNEKLHLPTWYRGIDTFIHYFLNLAGEA
jgi:acetylornithine deacetylase/succinyl-diaminopimelate desuccinylase-like protein